MSLLAVVLLCACSVFHRAERAAGGSLVIVGGGDFPDAIVARALDLSGGKSARVVVLPQASAMEGRGDDAVEMWREAGAREVTNLSDLADRGKARALLASADLIWLGGGDQVRLMQALREAELLELVRERHRAGATVAGTSAGAAVMGARMLTGGGDEALERIANGTTELVEGLRLLPGAIVDQHFVRRQRANRLLSAVLEHPEEIGVGIDERTAAVVTGGRLQVVGDGCVVIFDARAARIEHTERNAQAAARDLALHVLRDGMDFDLGR